MKKTAFMLFSAITFYCSGQEKIFLTTGDSLTGTVTKIDYDHSRIVKSDGTSIVILSNMIKNGDSFSSAQDVELNKFNIGLEGSPSIIFQRGNAFSGADASIGFSGGLFFQYNFQKKLSLRTNLNFERKGFRITSLINDINGNPIGQGTDHFNFDYLIIPVLLRTTLGKKAIFFVNAGVYGGYLIKATVTYRDFSQTDFTQGINPFDLGMTAGLGFAVPIKKKYLLSFELRNNTGLYNIDKPSANYSPVLKTNSINLLMGVAFNK